MARPANAVNTGLRAMLADVELVDGAGDQQRPDHPGPLPEQNEKQGHPEPAT